MTRHLVEEQYDRGPGFFALANHLEPGDIPETLASKVNGAEPDRQPRVLNFVVQGQVRLVGKETV